MNLISHIAEYLGDLSTPVSMYLRIRNLFPGSTLLESGDYHGNENSSSIIGINPLKIFERSFNSEEIRKTAYPELNDFYSSFTVKKRCLGNQIDSSFNGLIGYISFNSIPAFENIQFKNERSIERKIPEIRYTLYEYIVEINHFNNQLLITRNSEESSKISDSEALESIDRIYNLLNLGRIEVSDFKMVGDERSNMNDEEHIAIIEKCKHHIQRGDVFQIVPSRRYSQEYKGDDFQVYRALRSINPSPYLYYYDAGSFRLFGSSPEAQLILKEGTASTYPIAGTCPRVGNPARDLEMAEALLKDPKENAEHIMLVDLARNDLSRFCADVHVPTYREVQLYSHVIHLVSKVVGSITNNSSPFDLLASTFPAGTLSGAPKFRALQIIDALEKGSRENYGGAIGIINFNGNLNHAIMIRSFLSKDDVLYSQAGAGIVSESIPENEVEEGKNKLGALKRAVVMASNIKS